MATTVTYNGVVMHNVITREWNQEVIYDESNTDVVFHRFNLKFEGIVHQGDYRDSVAYVNDGSDAANMAHQYQLIHHRMLKNRESLIVATDVPGSENVTLFACGPAYGDPTSDAVLIGSLSRDVDNGPKPKSFRILQVIGGKCLRVAFEIECCKLICPLGYTGELPIGVLPHVLNNRWSVEEGMDENLFTTRVISGKMRLSTPVAATLSDAKWVVVPGLEDGFRRASVQFTVEPDGLGCTYRVTDRQVHSAAPWPATKMDVRHTSSTNEGVNMRNEVHVSLEGSPGADKKLLIARCVQIIDSILNFEALTEGNAFRIQFIPEHVAFTEYIGDSNRVEAIARFLETPKDGDIKTTFANMRKNLGKPLALPPDQFGNTYDPGSSFVPHIYGYNPPHDQESSGTKRSPAIVMLLQCYLQQPCRNQHYIAQGSIPGTTETAEQKPPYKPTEIVEEPEGSLPPYEPKENWSPSAKSAVYTYATATSRMQTDRCNVQLPIADSGDPDADTSKVFNLARAQCRRIIDVDVERAGKWPEIPPAKLTFTDEKLRGTLLKHWTEAHPPSLTADGVTPLYRLTAHYVYAMNRPPKESEKYRIGVAPQTVFAKTDDAVKFDPTQAYANPELEP